MKRLAWTAGAAAVAATVLLLRQPWNGAGADAPAAAPPVAEASVPPAPAPPVSSAQAHGQAPKSSRSAAAAAPPAASWHLCGIGRVPVPPGSPALAPGDLPALPDPVGRDAFESARRRTVAALLAGAPRARAAGLLMDPIGEPRPSRWAGRSTEDLRSEIAAALLQLGRDANDGVVLKWAHFMCPDAACQRAVSHAWTAAEPGNGFAWGMLAQDDAANADAAWRGLVRATDWHSNAGALSAAMLAAVPRDEPAFLRKMLLIETTGIEAAMSIPALAIAGQRCQAQPVATAQGSDCDTLARLLVERGDTVVALHQGRGIAKLAGWPDERLAEIDADKKALWAEYSRLRGDDRQPLNCASVEIAIADVGAMARLGEAGALRERLRSASAPR